ncbi:MULTISPECIES: VOC family protein [unclassified Mesorhizobium]|uniref:VOC family protein n=1 Tax=unclassified Mesorhizobium TaxID=325217 RepID=UPI002415067D|nr:MULTISPECIES: VOC family protein [unclassified Mesorhizobium]MDG4854846.1 VOC family protein [Mesorhizobium sp. WSM4982]MDG4914037.1 VOC family protein [Mesorhizobium sp. WSM4983]
MKARITVFTLGVDDLEASLKFYRDGLGLPTEGIIGREFEHGAVAFFELAGGLKFAIFERASIALDATVPQSSRSPTEFTIGHNVSSAAEVDAAMAEAVKAGARVAKPAQKAFWGGYAGYFQDPDDHLWEVVYNPAFIPKD